MYFAAHHARACRSCDHSGVDQMATDIFGPGAFGAARAVTIRPAATPNNTPGAADTFFRDCSTSTAEDGTEIRAAHHNFIAQNLRRLVRGAGVPEDNTDDDLVLKSVQAIANASSGSVPTHTHTKAQITDFAHDHPISDVTGLQVALNDLNSNVASLQTSLNGRAVRTQLFTSSGSWTVPAGVTRVRAIAVGGGSGFNTVTNIDGKNGGVSSGFYSVVPGSVISVTVGAGGAIGTSPGSGGTSSFGSHLSATGGSLGSHGNGSGGNILNSTFFGEGFIPPFFVSTQPFSQFIVQTAFNPSNIVRAGARGSGGFGMSGMVFLEWIGE
jgi:hypothetical protein